jgi:DNA uptake protein ComE-like DNA-binding protein
MREENSEVTSLHARQDRRVVALLILLVVCTFRAALVEHDVVASTAEHENTQGLAGECLVDPNSAPWWELTVLPRIGIGLAREIVDYRTGYLAARVPGDESLPFRGPGDLQNVRGIGPLTVARVAGELTFPRPKDR